LLFKFVFGIGYVIAEQKQKRQIMRHYVSFKVQIISM